MANITLRESELLILISEEKTNIAVIENCNDTKRIEQALIEFYGADYAKFELPEFDSQYNDSAKMECDISWEGDEEGDESIYTVTLQAIAKY